MPNSKISVEDLLNDVRRRAPAAGGAPIATGTLVLLRALDLRMNGNTVIASIPVPRPGEEPGRVFARWLDVSRSGVGILSGIHEGPPKLRYSA